MKPAVTQDVIGTAENKNNNNIITTGIHKKTKTHTHMIELNLFYMYFTKTRLWRSPVVSEWVRVALTNNVDNLAFL